MLGERLEGGFIENNRKSHRGWSRGWRWLKKASESCRGLLGLGVVGVMVGGRLFAWLCNIMGVVESRVLNKCWYRGASETSHSEKEACSVAGRWLEPQITLAPPTTPLSRPDVGAALLTSGFWSSLRTNCFCCLAVVRKKLFFLVLLF